MSAEQENQQPPAQPNPERKTLDDRAKMTELERIRHSCAHVMATAILRLWPEAQFAYGPPVENGFYYDLECSHRISPEDFEKIEAEIKKEIKTNNTFEKLTVTREQAIARAIARAQPGDIVLIAGKGHETTQQAGGPPRPFDDRVVAREELGAGPWT